MEHLGNEALEREFYNLMRPVDCIPIAECKADTVYWIGARSISSIAICRTTAQGIIFEGLREKMGDYFIFGEIHYDDGFGTARPYVELSPAPGINDEEELMSWFLDQEIEFIRTRIDWLKGMPKRYQCLDAYKYTLEGDLETLVFQERLKEEGFDAQERLTFKVLLEKTRRAREARTVS